MTFYTRLKRKADPEVVREMYIYITIKKNSRKEGTKSEVDRKQKIKGLRAEYCNIIKVCNDVSLSSLFSCGGFMRSPRKPVYQSRSPLDIVDTDVS